MILSSFSLLILICKGNHMNASAIKELHYKSSLKILSKLHEL